MPPSNRIHTLDDLSRAASPVGDGEDWGTLPAVDPDSNKTHAPSIPCFHLPSLPGAEQARNMLERVVREFAPIVHRRGYHVRSVSELCCCHDGLDFDNTVPRRRKRRRVASNVWGYNQTTFARGRPRSHTIHLRLRHATAHHRSHAYEDVAGTLAHELAHCEHSAHDTKFYKLMDEILDEHAALMASCLTRDGGRTRTPAFGGTGQALGGNSGIANLTAAQNRQQPLATVSKGYKLGGDGCFTQWMTPAEAAVVAAEARRRQQQLRLRGDRCCRPCTIEIFEGGEETENEEDRKPASLESSKKRPLVNVPTNALRPFRRSLTKPAPPQEVIDLTKECEDSASKDFPTLTAPKMAETSIGGKQPTATWSCGACTFTNKPKALACSICQTKRGSLTG
ncbi:predicted protein [Phaeodactylum tricornutum CCAP 1055/1]|uniref:Uncharacterized protein n=1 Tax=Phaeodactylum tricornutum (strain CCAP 1055/1) TaxID=556484 RepID=B7FPW5_PHATC|nr:predicted protein [Phaeodactylum tricornutum CCAP 1055/1]EEC51243.1 predicted protein [Phaeodactylum tricornutum CCAP 1055/1]|eukprot:XP_002176780.1 predicted protein [Phaeodactylum tricornutum CCAP 1055/1]